MVYNDILNFIPQITSACCVKANFQAEKLLIHTLLDGLYIQTGMSARS